MAEKTGQVHEQVEGGAVETLLSPQVWHTLGYTLQLSRGNLMSKAENSGERESIKEGQGPGPGREETGYTQLTGDDEIALNLRIDPVL